jgi:transcriptional regulator with XRE-family HTH domain
VSSPRGFLEAPNQAKYGLYSLEQDWCKIVGKNVRKIRQQRRMTQEELAFEAEIDLTYVGGIERGKRNPSLMVMARVAQALSVPLAKLLNE